MKERVIDEQNGESKEDEVIGAGTSESEIDKLVPERGRRRNEADEETWGTDHRNPETM